MWRERGEQGVSELGHEHVCIQEAAFLHGHWGFSAIPSLLPENHIIILSKERKRGQAAQQCQSSLGQIYKSSPHFTFLKKELLLYWREYQQFLVWLHKYFCTYFNNPLVWIKIKNNMTSKNAKNNSCLVRCIWNSEFAQDTFCPWKIQHNVTWFTHPLLQAELNCTALHKQNSASDHQLTYPK